MGFIFKGIFDRIILSDPGFVRLRMGSRALLTTGLVCAVLALLHPWMQMPAAAYAIAMISAIQGIASIKDTTVAARAVTRVYAAISGFCVLAVLSLLDQSFLLANAFLLVVIFLAVYARRFGARWQAVGMFAFMCCVVGAFLKPRHIDLEPIALSLCLSGFIAHLVRNFLLPERADVDCRRAMKAASIVIDRLSNLIAANALSGWTDVSRRDTEQLARQARDAILVCEGYLPVGRSGSFADEHAAFLAMRLFDLHLAVESALGEAWSATEINSRNISPALKQKLENLQDALENADKALAATPTESFSATTGPGRKVPLFPARGEWLSDKTVRQAFQVTVASAIAMAGGVILSPDRWFWAVLTAFLVFAKTQSSGDVAVRALDRTLGTAIGIVIGIGLATLVHGELYLTIGLVAVSIFAAFYLVSTSYSAMSFFITLAIALVYGLLGEFTPGLLVLRLEETVVGVGAGIFVSLFVLPMSTRSEAREAMDRFLNSLDDFVGEILSNEGADSARLVISARSLDQAKADVRDAFGPMQSSWTFGRRQEKSKRVLLRVAMLVHAAHILARQFGDQAPTTDEKKRLQSIRTQLADLLAGHRDMSRGSNIAGARPSEREVTASRGPTDYALGLIALVLSEADTRIQS